MVNFNIVSLSERPEFADTCAAWSYAQWGCYLHGRTLNEFIENYKKRAKNINTLPLIWIALQNDKMAGMVSLKDDDGHPDLKHLTPWLGSMFVHSLYRGKGAASALIGRVVNEAKKMGFPQLYLFTPDAVGLYEKHGFKVIDVIKDTRGYTDTENLMMRTLN